MKERGQFEAGDRVIVKDCITTKRARISRCVGTVVRVARREKANGMQVRCARVLLDNPPIQTTLPYFFLDKA